MNGDQPESAARESAARESAARESAAQQQAAQRFAELFRAVYLTFHRRDGPRGQLPGASRAVLEHLAMAGPLTVGEAAGHLSRTQSVVSDIVSHLVRQGLLERESDPADRRRTLVWLTPAGHEALRRDREVLSVDRLATALAELPEGQADALLTGLRALVDQAAATPRAATPRSAAPRAATPRSTTPRAVTPRSTTPRQGETP